MLHPLDGARAKLDRAYEDIKNLAERTSAFIDDHCTVTEEAKPHGTAFHFRTNATPIDLLPISVMTGEILFHLRSCLDHVMWRLVRDRPAERRTETFISFPIHKSVENYRAARKRMNVETIEGADALIEAAQPYNRGNIYSDDSLWIVNNLAKIDRHRLLVVVQATASLALIDEGRWIGTTPFKRIDNETSVILKCLGAKVEMERIPHFAVALDEVGVSGPYPIGILLQLLAQATRATVEEFAPLFGVDG